MRGNTLLTHQQKTVRYWVGEHEDEMVCLTLSNEPGSVLASDWGRVYLFGLPRVPKVTMDISDSRQETRVVSQLSLADFHHVCRCEGHHCSFRLPPGEYVVLGSIVQEPQTPDAPVVALMDCGFLGRVRSQGWNADRGDDFPRKAGVVMGNGWTRFSLTDLTADGRVKSPRCRCDLYLEDDSAKANAHAWLAQANHVLSVLGVTQNLGSYALVDEIICYIYLELAPEAHLMYWALDPGGTERLPANAAAALGLPTLEFYAKVMGVGWQAYHYNALMHFHRAKGFDPCSQEVARHMEYPLLLAAPPVCTVVDGVFFCVGLAAHIQRLSVDQGDDDMTLVDFEGSTNAAREATTYGSMGKGGLLPWIICWLHTCCHRGPAGRCQVPPRFGFDFKRRRSVFTWDFDYCRVRSEFVGYIVVYVRTL
ncbi:hypothetical protein GGX14DRAFT_465461 [Mycena pura]|uniref:Uncharacterized protein n=1 Tax=Mycena pura TaxID=153505 RepID=A0AAD6V5M6_9AGAR|nr:hypothetical protein GGX14DRAFT_465508 [Mycena pura]KAJ7201435.1 hypothetical protein GGX14DRAFT_465461 [Mycena pura]